MRAKIVPDVVERREVLTVTPDVTVRAAARLMAERRVAAVLVEDGGALTGIFTERDITVRVVAAGLDPAATTVGQVMSTGLTTLAVDDSPAEALALMRRHGLRHLPVIEAGRAVAMVSVRDLYAAVQERLESDISERDAYIFGLGRARVDAPE
jgi:CBS domain-containing protein